MVINRAYHSFSNHRLPVTNRCDDQGFDPLAALFKRTAIEEMLHIERMAERILFLKGEVDLRAGREVEKIHDVSEMLAKSIEMEQMSIKDYNQFANECGQAADAATKKIFEDLVAEEEVHFDNFDTQQEHINRYGEQFLALQSFERGKAIGSGPAGGGEAG